MNDPGGPHSADIAHTLGLDARASRLSRVGRRLLWLVLLALALTGAWFWWQARQVRPRRSLLTCR